MSFLYSTELSAHQQQVFSEKKYQLVIHLPLPSRSVVLPKKESADLQSKFLHLLLEAHLILMKSLSHAQRVHRLPLNFLEQPSVCFRRVSPAQDQEYLLFVLWLIPKKKVSKQSFPVFRFRVSYPESPVFRLSLKLSVRVLHLPFLDHSDQIQTLRLHPPAATASYQTV